MALELHKGGVNQGPFGSLIREKYGISNFDNDAVFSAEGIAALTFALKEYKDAGATIGGAPTFRITDHRAAGKDDAWEYNPARQLVLSSETQERNAKAVDVAREVFGNEVVGLIAPTADTSGIDDQRWQALGKVQVDWAMQRQRP